MTTERLLEIAVIAIWLAVLIPNVYVGMVYVGFFFMDKVWPFCRKMFKKLFP